MTQLQDKVVVIAGATSASGRVVARALVDAGARVIVVSADVQRTTAQLVADAGAVRFLGKPVSPEGLLEAVSAFKADLVVVGGQRPRRRNPARKSTMTTMTTMIRMVRIWST